MNDKLPKGIFSVTTNFWAALQYYVVCTWMQPIVTNQVGWSVSQSVTVVSPAKTAQPIQMPFGSRTVRRKEPCIRWGLNPPWKGAILRRKGRLTVKYRDTLW